NAWIDVARNRCAETKHVTGGDLQIGFLLARGPADPDGSWPHVAIRNVIERLRNEVIDEHIQIGLYNSRGVTSRSPTEGGAQERALADKYRTMSDAIKTKWPLTVALLRAMADRYDHDAKGQDVDSELHDFRWD